jgi:hypothetical protein
MKRAAQAVKYLAEIFPECGGSETLVPYQDAVHEAAVKEDRAAYEEALREIHASRATQGLVDKERGGVSVVLVVVLSSLISAVIGVFGILVAQREHRRGSRWWAWVVPGTFGALLIVLGLVRLVWVL